MSQSGDKNKAPWYTDGRMYVFIFIVLTLFMLKGLFGGGPSSLSCGPTTAADFEVVSLAGETLNSSQLEGQVVFLNFWATWCKPCVGELPEIQNLQKHYADRPDFRIVGVACDEGETGQVKKFIDDYNRRRAVEPITFPMFHDNSGDAAKAYGVDGFPTTYLIDRSGQVRKRFIGPREWDDKHFFALVDELLAEQPGAVQAP
jgi:cytochrome c biogenesis protein CcmG, thiol:disulfide interchange protein DsbE